MKHVRFIVWVLSGLTLFAFVACDQRKPIEDISANDVFNSASAGGSKKQMKTIMRFESDSFNFGTAIQGEKVAHAYRFKNLGTSNLIIVNATGSCGCTVPEWPKKPIPPGGEGVINVQFDTQGREGNQIKSITINANTEPSTTKLYLTGTVLKP